MPVEKVLTVSANGVSADASISNDATYTIKDTCVYSRML